MSKTQQIRSMGYEHFTGKEGAGFRLFDVIKCEICSDDLCGANSIHVHNVTRKILESAGLTERSAPLDEGGYSDLHGCATCSACCYDENAVSKNQAKVKAAHDAKLVPDPEGRGFLAP